MNDENLNVEEMEEDDKSRINISRPLFLLSLLAMFFLGMFMTLGMRWLIPVPAQVVTAEALQSMSIDEIDEYYGSKEVRVVGAEVKRLVDTSAFLITDVGEVFFKDDNETYMVREGERFTFTGRLIIDRDGSIRFSNSKFISLYEEEEEK